MGQKRTCQHLNARFDRSCAARGNNTALSLNLSALRSHQRISELNLQKDKTMITKTLFAGLLTAGFLSASFAVDAQADPRRSQQVKNVGTTQSGARAGMDNWPQTMDELDLPPLNWSA